MSWIKVDQKPPYGEKVIILVEYDLGNDKPFYIQTTGKYCCIDGWLFCYPINKTEFPWKIIQWHKLPELPIIED